MGLEVLEPLLVAVAVDEGVVRRPAVHHVEPTMVHRGQLEGHLQSGGRGGSGVHADHDRPGRGVRVGVRVGVGAGRASGGVLGPDHRHRAARVGTDRGAHRPQQQRPHRPAAAGADDEQGSAGGQVEQRLARVDQRCGDLDVEVGRQPAHPAQGPVGDPAGGDPQVGAGLRLAEQLMTRGRLAGRGDQQQGPAAYVGVVHGPLEGDVAAGRSVHADDDRSLLHVRGHTSTVAGGRPRREGRWARSCGTFVPVPGRPRRRAGQ